MFMVQSSFQSQHTFHASFSLLNPSAKQSPPLVYVYTSGPGVKVLPHPIQSSVFEGDKQYVHPVSQKPTILSAFTEESKKVETKMNEIVIKLPNQGHSRALPTWKCVQMQLAIHSITCGTEIHLSTRKESTSTVILLKLWHDSPPPGQGAWFCSASDHGWIE